MGKLLDGTEGQALLDTGASKSFMSKWCYLHCKSFHSLPKFASRTQRIQEGNGQFFQYFVYNTCNNRHRFDIYILVYEIHENLDLALGMKNIIKLEGVINLHDCCFNFLNRSLPIYPKECIVLKPCEQKLITEEAPFPHEISGLASIKILDQTNHRTMMLKFKLMLNLAMLDMTNNDLDTIILDPKEMLRIIDLRTLGYHTLRWGTLQQNVSKYKQILQIQKGRHLLWPV